MKAHEYTQEPDSKCPLPAKVSSHPAGFWGRKGTYVEWISCCEFPLDDFRGRKAKERPLKAWENLGWVAEFRLTMRSLKAGRGLRDNRG